MLVKVWLGYFRKWFVAHLYSFGTLLLYFFCGIVAELKRILWLDASEWFKKYFIVLGLFVVLLIFFLISKLMIESL